MAVSQSKLPVHRAQPTRRAYAGHKRSKSLRKVLQFPQVAGKLVEDVEFSSDPGYHSISINFKDKTSLNLAITANFGVKGDYSDWKTGDQRVIRRWPPARNLEFADF
jgi:hypothetical protein